MTQQSLGRVEGCFLDFDVGGYEMLGSPFKVSNSA